ncbi:DUF4434 family protein [Pseudomonas citronellolis]|uniref:DUF4434 family protein n=1 Tax=Pseudomonas citronellolis TaxID=53408 RepID=UPI0023E47833|nr:DUF4434 family protein [Pseudomonas citronellolis]MDF3935741.1 DUF4434 family protein [Pseudomonas citronellolis]
MRHCLYLIALLAALALPAQAEERLFYQPLNADAALDQAQWRQIWQASAAQGVRTLIVQWSAYGSDTFGGPGGWLERSLQQAHDAGLRLIVGLYMDPAYYRRLEELDGPGLETYWQYQLGRSLTQQRLLRRDWKLPVAGWYLPLELDDLHFLDEGRRQTLRRQLKDFAGQLDAPLQLSAFSAGKLAPAVYAAWLQDLTGLGIQVWWQDGSGTAALSPLARQAYAGALPCAVGIVQEAFRQTSAPGQPFRAEPAALQAAPGCHALAVFELRYRPWAGILRTPAAPAP